MKHQALAALGWAAALVAAGALPLKHDVQGYEHLRRSVVRIQAVSENFDWFRPFESSEDSVGLGSGFVVQTEPFPIFATNEHVINNARRVALQLLVFGERMWEAEVIAVTSQFDLALLVLREPELFRQALKEKNLELHALELSTEVLPMGAEVVAMGFPLGQASLKISKGNFAGNQDVSGKICLQSTAPISPGSSGGPLLDADGSKVVGVNFAKATSGENVNYVIPAWRVQQLLARQQIDQGIAPADGHWKRIQVRVPVPDLTTVESNEALYALHPGCHSGIYITRVGERSFFNNAEPKVPSQAFLVSANGVKLDEFGMGRNPKFAAEGVMFDDLFLMSDSLEKPVEFETCAHGKVTKHVGSLEWKSEYERGINYVEEPSFANVDYEVFGGVTIMQMTVNHIDAVVDQMGDPGPARWLHPDLVSKPRLMVTALEPGTYASDLLSPGAAIAKVNGHEVRTLEELRKHFEPAGGEKAVWTLETDMSREFAVMFSKGVKYQVEESQNLDAPHLLTVAVAQAAKKLGFADDDGDSPAEPAGPATDLPELAAGAPETKKLLLRYRGAPRQRALRHHGSLLARRGVGPDAPPLGAGLLVRAAGPLVAVMSSDGRVAVSKSVAFRV